LKKGAKNQDAKGSRKSGKKKNSRSDRSVKKGSAHQMQSSLGVNALSKSLSVRRKKSNANLCR